MGQAVFVGQLHQATGVLIYPHEHYLAHQKPITMNTTTNAPVPSPEFAKLIEIEMKRLEALQTNREEK